MRQRRWWPPDAGFVLVIALSAALGVWPLADPQWTNKAAYLVVVVAMLIVGALISARDRWRLERRYASDFGAQIIGIRARVFALQKRLADVARNYRRAQEAASTLPDVDDAYFDFSDEYAGTMSALVHLGILMPDRLISVMDKSPKTIADLQIILEELITMNGHLGELYTNTLLGDA